MHSATVAESHLEFLRMGVDIDLHGIQRQVQEPGRMAAAIHDVLVSEPGGIHQQPVAHHAAIDEKVLAIRLRARLRRHSDPARQPQALVLVLDMQRV